MQKAIYTTVGIDELLPHVQALKGTGARFVQMHAERCVDDGSYRLVYTFIDVRAAQEHIAQDGSYAIENLVVEGIDQYQEIPSISSYYPAVFPFENEAHDLFGLAITDMQIDFKGFFYQVSTAEPMSVITPEVKAAGGLAIIGTERHESRRVDRQLRGRAGRQGDPGSSQFFVSLEDDLMRLFGSGRIASMMDRMGLKEGEVIQAGMMTKAIERAQKKVEENNFGIRKRLLEYDDVMNSQREVIYTRRRHALYGERIEIDLNNIMYDYADNFVEENRGIEFEDFRMELIREVAVEPQIDEATYKDAKPGELVEAIVKALKEAYARRAKAVADTVRPVMERIYEDRKDQLDSNIYFPLTDGHLGYNVPVNLRKCQSSDGAEIYKVFSKVVMFTTIDDAWREHLREMDDLRQSVQNATYEQKDPLLIYKFESFGLFSKMIIKVNRDVLAILNKAYIPVRDQNAEAVQRQQQERAKVDVNKLQASRMQAAAQAGQEERQKPMPLHAEKKAGRNDPCPCGSGKKYKNCHGKGL